MSDRIPIHHVTRATNWSWTCPWCEYKNYHNWSMYLCQKKQRCVQCVQCEGLISLTAEKVIIITATPFQEVPD